MVTALLGAVGTCGAAPKLLHQAVGVAMSFASGTGQSAGSAVTAPPSKPTAEMLLEAGSSWWGSCTSRPQTTPLGRTGRRGAGAGQHGRASPFPIPQEAEHGAGLGATLTFPRWRRWHTCAPRRLARSRWRCWRVGCSPPSRSPVGTDRGQRGRSIRVTEPPSLHPPDPQICPCPALVVLSALQHWMLHRGLLVRVLVPGVPSSCQAPL